MPRSPIHPGEILSEELDAQGLSIPDASNMNGLSVSTITKLLAQSVDITDTIAEKLGHLFGSGPELWLNLQKRYDDFPKEGD